MLPKYQYFVPWISKIDQKRLKRQQLPFNMGRFCIMVTRMMIFGFEEAPRVCYTLPKQSASYIQYFWKNHFSNIRIIHSLWPPLVFHTSEIRDELGMVKFDIYWYNTHQVSQFDLDFLFHFFLYTKPNLKSGYRLVLQCIPEAHIFFSYSHVWNLCMLCEKRLACQLMLGGF